MVRVHSACCRAEAAGPNQLNVTAVGNFQRYQSLLWTAVRGWVPRPDQQARRRLLFVLARRDFPPLGDGARSHAKAM
jgi:hypothetical protein